MKHLTDDIIQEYFDSAEKRQRSEVEYHVIICLECREKLEQYRELYQHLSIETEPLPDELFNSSVLAAVERLESKKNVRQMITFTSVLAGMSLLVFSLTFFGWVSWGSVFSGAQSILSKSASPLIEAASTLVEKLNGNLELLAFAGLALLLFQLLDYGLIRHKFNRT